LKFVVTTVSNGYILTTWFASCFCAVLEISWNCGLLDAVQHSAQVRESS